MSSLSLDLIKFEMSDTQFEKLSKLIYEYSGILIPDKKRSMLNSRLKKRLKEKGESSADDYIDHLFSDNGAQEVVFFIDHVTTNKTFFFREDSHFVHLVDYLVKHWKHSKGNQTFFIWSAACSTGEEPYTLAFVLEEFKRKINSSFDYKILATDLSTRVLEIASDAIYPIESLSSIPDNYHKKYLMLANDGKRFKVKNELRNKVIFNRLNFMDKKFNITNKFDVIFCRNAMIYFDKDTQKELVLKFHNQLVDNGQLFIGHSESLQNFKLPFKMVIPTVYQRI